MNLQNVLNIIQKRWKYKLNLNGFDIILSFDIGKYIIPDKKESQDFSVIEIEYNSNEIQDSKTMLDLEKIIEPLSILDFGNYTKMSKYEKGVKNFYVF